MSKVYFADNNDPFLEVAIAAARETFRDFWKEAAMDFNRIIPALELAAVKTTFTDNPDDPDSPVEQMWLNEVYFDGKKVRGVLLNQPNWIQSVSEGDPVEFPLNRLTDWMYVINSKAYGAFTVQAMRANMGFFARRKHDKAWGLTFPKPGDSWPVVDTSGIERGIAENLAEAVAEQPNICTDSDDQGQTHLHKESLRGRLPTVQVLLDKGADVNAKCARGWTPLRYAMVLDWKDTMALLESRGGRT